MQGSKDQTGQSGQQSQAFSQGKVDARYGEEPHVITDRLRSTMANAAQGEFLVIGKRQDGSPFLWGTGDEERTRELAKEAAPVLANL